MMNRAMLASAAATSRRMWHRTATGAAGQCQKRPLPTSTKINTAPILQQVRDSRQVHRSCPFSTNAPSSSMHDEQHEDRSEDDLTAQEEQEQEETQDTVHDVVDAPGATSPSSSLSSSSSSPMTTVKHPPAPGWEYPPVPAGCEPKFAIIRLGNTQHKVTKDDVIVAEKLAGDIGETLDITDVLLLGTRDETVVGRPMVPGATVKLFVEEQTRDKKVIVLKKRRRKSSKTTQGHRREVTLLRVMDILP